MDDKAIDILNSRYSDLRKEILMRLEYRYKIVNLILLLITASITVIWKLAWYDVSFIACFFILFATLILLGESKQIISISNYLGQIDKTLDEELKLRPIGWERFTRIKSHNPEKGTKLLVVGYAVIFFLIYVTFALIGVLKTQTCLEVTLLSYKVDVFLISMISALITLPLFLAVGVIKSYRGYWRLPTDDGYGQLITKEANK